MPRGGLRPGAGRPKGTPNPKTKRTVAYGQKAAAAGVTPLDVMLGTMRALWAKALKGDEIDYDKAAQASAVAKDAAPYVHPKLANVEHTGADGGAIKLAIGWMTGESSE